MAQLATRLRELREANKGALELGIALGAFFRLDNSSACSRLEISQVATSPVPLMSSLSGLVHLRTIDVPSQALQAKTLDDVEEVSLTTCERARRHNEPVAYNYSRPKDDDEGLSVLDDVIVRCRLRQLVLSSINLSVKYLKALCRLNGIEGYSSRHMEAKELFLRLRLWTCDPVFRDPYQWNEYFTDANFPIFCCVVCSERVFGHAVRWVPESHLRNDDLGILDVLTDARIRPDLRPKSYDFNAWRSAVIDPRGLHRARNLQGQPVYSATDVHQSAQSLLPTTGRPTTPARSLSNGFYRAQEHVPNDIQECFSKDMRGVYSKSFTPPSTTLIGPIRLSSVCNSPAITALGTVTG
ncbi:BQ2448_3949 [Microbotryum intermedium]|uniref:BQ2448_3949 protein n=1 Tax=Microbotryum intermedium TaxID=269621 RepID=A0A238FF18_9BASI|nr:BQ2448_3949 [Microbotryum intermedium]